MNCPEDGKECWSSGCFFQHGLNKVCSKRNLTVATGGTVIMKEQDAAHSFEGRDHEQLKIEINHILESGPNDIRLIELFERYYNRGAYWFDKFTRLRSELQQEHDKARNQAIDDCIEILLDELEDESNTREEMRQCSSTIKRMESLKTKP